MTSDRTDKGPIGNSRGGFSQIGRRMNDPILDSLKQYWEKLRAGRLAPYRSEIDPRQFEHALENMFILEILADHSVRVRLAGMRLCELMGMEVRGMSPQAFMMPEDRQRFEGIVHSVAERPAVVECTLETVDYSGKSGTAYLLLMPLRNDFGEITRILGCISDTGDRFEAPVRFRVTRVSTDDIVFSGEQAPMPGFAEMREGYKASESRPAFSTIEGGATREEKREKPSGAHLRLVDKD